MSKLVEIAQRIGSTDGTKGLENYAVYERYFADFVARPVTLMEVGVYRGESVRAFATYFANGKVIGVDLNLPPIDAATYPNLVLERADQTNERQLGEICARHAPGGLDIVVEDASHLGAPSLACYRALISRLNPGGLYIVEDWGTGYWNDWPDGREFQQTGRRWYERGLQRRIRSHDYGMVGFLKSLFEDVSVDIAPTRGAPRTREPVLEFLHLYGNLAVLKKRSG